MMRYKNLILLGTSHIARQSIEEISRIIEEIKPEIRYNVGKELILRTVPKLEFHMDDGVENAERIETILNTLKH